MSNESAGMSKSLLFIIFSPWMNEITVVLANVTINLWHIYNG